jgi:hypothetical protein
MDHGPGREAHLEPVFVPLHAAHAVAQVDVDASSRRLTASRSEISASSIGASCCARSIMVTRTPRAAKIEAYSQPIPPPPVMAMRLRPGWRARTRPRHRGARG